MRFTSLSRLCAVFAVIALLVPGVLLAQNATTGAISGTVTDPSNAVIGSATVSLTNVKIATGLSTSPARSVFRCCSLDSTRSRLSKRDSAPRKSPRR